jgi:hypothetical protein
VVGWQDKWASMQSKLESCLRECREQVRSDQKCKDSIEAVMADLWHFKDWLENDPSTAISRSSINQFLTTPEASHITACGDLAAVDKHFRADDPRRRDTKLHLEAVEKYRDGGPLVFSAIRDYGDGNIDRWEDAVELAIRARDQWAAFLQSLGMRPTMSTSSIPPRV